MPYVLDPDRPHLGGNVVGGDHRSFYPGLWAWLVREFGVSRVLDVGCGAGEAMAEFARLCPSVVGVDGLPANVEAASAFGEAHVRDLCDGPFLARPRPDLVWCCEVVEHVAEDHLGSLLKTICQGRVLAMTHAVPGQGGHHHVNCRDARYWIDRVESLGMRFLPAATEASRPLGHHYWSATGMIFARPGDPAPRTRPE